MLFSATGSRSNAKAAYRLLANKKFTTEKLAKGNAKKVIEMMEGEPVVLLVQDTTDASYNTHKKTEGLGYSSEKVLGAKIHTCLAMSVKGIPFGVMAQNCFTREKSKNELSNSEKSKRPIELTLTHKGQMLNNRKKHKQPFPNRSNANRRVARGMYTPRENG